jgi:SAM-dependent methyltransferase
MSRPTSLAKLLIGAVTAVLLSAISTSAATPVQRPALPLRARNIMRGIVQRYGTSRLKRRLWDWEFSNGRWNCLEETPDDPAYPHLAAYARRGRILDLGCGPGSAGRYLDAAAYSSYIGVDISDVAVQEARRKNQRPQNTYVQSDILSYRPDGEFDVILFGDSLYYIPRSEVIGMLQRFVPHLGRTGVFMVKMHDTPAYRPLFEILRTHFTVVEEHQHPPIVLIVFR